MKLSLLLFANSEVSYFLPITTCSHVQLQIYKRNLKILPPFSHQKFDNSSLHNNSSTILYAYLYTTHFFFHLQNIACLVHYFMRFVVFGSFEGIVVSKLNLWCWMILDEKKYDKNLVTCVPSHKNINFKIDCDLMALIRNDWEIKSLQVCIIF